MFVRALGYFQRMSLREKVLLLLFLWVMLIIALQSILGQLRLTLTQVRSDRVTIAAYRPVVEQEDQVRQQLEQVRDQFDPDLTLSGPELDGRVDELARNSGLRPARLDRSRNRVGFFDEYTADVRFEDVQIRDLLRFASLLRQDSPYLYIEGLRLTDNERNPELVDVPSFEINSFELGSDLEAR